MQFIATSSKTPALARSKAFQSPQRFGHCFLKVAESQKAFKSSKNQQNHYHEIEHLLTLKREDAQDLAHFLEVVIKVKNFLRLSHLYQRLRYNCTRQTSASKDKISDV